MYKVLLGTIFNVLQSDFMGNDFMEKYQTLDSLSIQWQPVPFLAASLFLVEQSVTGVISLREKNTFQGPWIHAGSDSWCERF